MSNKKERPMGALPAWARPMCSTVRCFNPCATGNLYCRACRDVGLEYWPQMLALARAADEQEDARLGAA